MLIWLYPLIAEGLATGDCVPIMESGWWLRAETVSGRLQASFWLSRRVGESQLPVVPAPASPPHVTLTVTRSGSPEGRPVMEASVAGIAALEDTDLLEQAAGKAGDLERCVAWAWCRRRRYSASLSPALPARSGRGRYSSNAGLPLKAEAETFRSGLLR